MSVPAAGCPRRPRHSSLPYYDWYSCRDSPYMAVRPAGTTSTLCTSAGGHRLEETATRRLFRLMFPEVCAHFESPRQEEHRSTPAKMRTVALSSAVVPSVGRQERGALTSAGSNLDRLASQLSEGWG